MGILDTFKSIYDIAIGYKNAELNQEILEGQKQLFDLTNENQVLKDEIHSLKEKLELKGKMDFDDDKGMYFIEGEKTPYCPLCWDNEKKAIHLRMKELSNGDHSFRCPKCDRSFNRKYRGPSRNCSDDFNPHSKGGYSD